MIPVPFPKYFIFDLDGTLVDSAPDLSHALNHILQRLNRPAIPLEDVRHLTGRGARALIKRGLAVNGLDLTGQEIDHEMRHFLDYYRNNIAVETRAYPGARDLLKLLRERGAKIGLCTNKSEGLSRQLLAALDLTDYFDAVIGGDTLSVRKPHPDHVLGTIKAVGGSPEESLYFGDSETDFNACRAANVPIILVRFGYCDVPVESLGADGITDSYTDIIRLVRAAQA